MARNPERISGILQLVRDLWNRYPDMRFIQLLDYITDGKNCKGDLFYMEDDDLIDKIMEKIKEV